MNRPTLSPPRKTGVHQAVGVIPVTMTSREIADLVEKRHDNVKRAIDDLTARALVHPQIEDGRFADALGRPRTEAVYRICKRDSYVIVAQLSPEFTARLVDRWQELEAEAARPVVLSRMEVLRMALDSEQRAIDAEKLASEREILIGQQKPAVEFVDRYVTSTGNKGFREVCKLLRVNEREFGAWLDAAGITYRLAGERTAHQHHVNAGRFVTKAGTAGGEGGHAFNQLKWTPKGVVWIAAKWKKHLQIQGGAA